MDSQLSPFGDQSNVSPHSTSDPAQSSRGVKNVSTNDEQQMNLPEFTDLLGCAPTVRKRRPTVKKVATHIQERTPLGEVTNLIRCDPDVATKRTTGKKVANNVQERAPLAELTNLRCPPNFATPVSKGKHVVAGFGTNEPTTQDVTDWFNQSYNNLLSSSTDGVAPDFNTTQDVANWFNDSYNNLLPSCTEGIVGPELNQSVPADCVGNPFHISSVSSESLEIIAAEHKKRRERERYASMGTYQKQTRLQRSREYKRRKRHTPNEQVPLQATTAPTTQGSTVSHVCGSGLLTGQHIDEDIHNSQGQANSQDAQHIDDDGIDDDNHIWLGQGMEQQMPPVSPDSYFTDGIPDPYDIVYHNLPSEHHVLKSVPQCRYCAAKRFQYESPGFCCRSGKVYIATPDVPDELCRLFTSQDDDSKYFRDHIRHFNSHFSFTSLGVRLDRDLASSRNGIYTFRIQGQIYHKLDNLVPEEHGPRHMQLYFYDTDADLAHRAHRSPNLRMDIISNLVGILQDNPYVQTFRGLGDVPNLDNYKIKLNTSITLDQRVYNAPTASQVAAIWVDGNDPQNSFDRSVLVYGRNGERNYIKAYHACYDPLSYPLFYPSGETGWHRHIPFVGAPLNEQPYRDFPAAAEEDEAEKEESGSCVSARQYYCFKLQIRVGNFNIVLYGRRLFQQWVVDIYIKIETMRLDFFSMAATQKLIRADLYRGIVDTIVAGETNAAMVGTLIVLPATFHGGQRDMRRRFMDAMCLVQRYGKPDLFVTMTCNPWWDEIVTELLPGQEPQDRPDLVARVFRAKLRDIKELMFKHDYFGKVAAYVHVTEFQKRGLPHEHFLLIMETDCKLTTPEHYDKWISAEIPDKKKYLVLHNLVIKHMMHGPCGFLKKNNPCMVNDECKFRYPRQFCNSTQQGKDSYPVYRRRDDGRRETVRHATLDNRWVVPYNPGLLMRYNCHINVEACSSIKAVKYLFKYIYKDHDRASFTIDDVRAGVEVNEIKQYRDARFISPPEALWRIYGFDLFEQKPPVLQLQLHLPDEQPVTFRQGEDLRDVINKDSSTRTMLTEYFRMNRECSYARKFLYKEFLERYVWKTGGGNKRWEIRQQRTQLGRIVQANPKEGERFYLRQVLNHKLGAFSFQDLRTVNGEICPTFQLAAERMGLLEADTTLDDCLTEAATFQMPSALRRLFATILVFCEATQIRDLWNNHLESMSEDFFEATHRQQSGGAVGVGRYKGSAAFHGQKHR